MPRLLSVAVTATLCLTLTASAEEKLPQGMKPILDKVVRDVRTNREAFDKANKKPLEEARKALEALSTKLIKDGKTVDAGVVLKQVETLEADVMKMANAPAPVAGGGRLAPQKQLLERLEGRWTHPSLGLVYFFSRDGTFHEDQKSNGAVNATGRIAVIGDEVAQVALDNGFRFQVRPAGVDFLAISVWDPSGTPMPGVVVERVR